MRKLALTAVALLALAGCAGQPAMGTDGKPLPEGSQPSAGAAIGNVGLGLLGAFAAGASAYGQGLQANQPVRLQTTCRRVGTYTFCQ